ncbi:MAG: hypothetical protein KC800_17175 [Candidatus Eremiobacteraeota bacterium]|nr:hypothetical protein [Candidatus Eremiobacteraeota bacterium]
MRLLKNGGDLNVMVSEMDRLARKTRNRQTLQMLNIAKSAGLVYLGRWESAIETLESMSKDDFRIELHKTLYLNNLLYAYLLARKFSKARRLFALEETLIVPERKHNEINQAVVSTLATYRYFFDSPESSRRLFESLNGIEMDTRAKSSILYFLGRLDLYEGREPSGWQKIEESRACSMGSFVEQEVASLRSGHPRIGAPGDGALEPVELPGG